MEGMNEVEDNVEIDKVCNMRILTVLIATRIDKNVNGAIGVNNS